MTAARKPKEFPKFFVGDIVQAIEYGPKADHRTVLEVGERDDLKGYIKVSGRLGWHSARQFAPVPCS